VSIWPQLRKLRPGWYVLAGLLFYSVAITASLLSSHAEVRELRRAQLELVAAPQVTAPAGLWFPIVGAHLPQDPRHWPGAPREFRLGVSQGFTFADQDAGVPIPYGTPVIASGDGVLIRVDLNYSELSPEAWQALIDQVGRRGATEDELDRLRGRQIWLQLDDGRLLRYGHLSRVREGLSSGQRVYRGQVIGYVGNSGTDGGVRGTLTGARLHYEIWQDNSYFGAGLDADTARLRAALLFVGP
jgi:murein DD-endopeptidase MepM/ murein hydrolase activator NlpD